MISLDRLMGMSPKPVRRGQILVVVALSMLGLLATAGIATDVGILLMRKAQFDRAVDGAALAGVPKVADPDAGIDVADKRGLEVISANGITLANTNPDPGHCPLPANYSYCGEEIKGNLPGSTDYHVEARWNVTLAFMSILRIYSVPLVSTAEASYYDNVDIFTSGNDQGVLQSANMELFGPESCAANGDAFSPTSYWRNEGPAITTGNPYYSGYSDIVQGVYTYRIAIPEDYQTETRNLVRVELFDAQTGNLDPSGPPSTNMNLSGSPNFSGGSVTKYLPTNVEDLDPSTVAIDSTNRCVNSSGGDVRTTRESPCLYGRDADTTGFIDVNNPFWYVRMDENRRHCWEGGGYTQSANTKTRFTLYYYKQQASGQLTRVNLAQYTGMADDGSTPDWWKTALMWVSPVQLAGTITPTNEQMPSFTCQDVAGAGATCSSTTAVPMVGSPAEPRVGVDACPPVGGVPCPGNGDFIINLNPDDTENSQPANEVPNIYQDPTTKVRYLYLDVKSMTGSSENNWALWAGPALSQDPSVEAPAFINARQIYVLRQSGLGNKLHSSQGIVTYGVGHLPMNSDSKSRVRFPLASIGPELAGAPMKIRIYDSDAGTEPPIAFYYDTIPQADWSMCWGTATGCNTEGSPLFWQQRGSPPAAFGPTCTGWSCGQWAIFEFNNPTDATPDSTNPPPVPFYGGRLMVDYKGGQQDTFGWWITVGARPSLVN